MFAAWCCVSLGVGFQDAVIIARNLQSGKVFRETLSGLPYFAGGIANGRSESQKFTDRADHATARRPMRIGRGNSPRSIMA
jgi:hypothetical protein